MLTVRDDRAFWNQRYRDSSQGAREPDPLLLEAYDEFIRPLFPKPGKALDVAGGTGRHALWLAKNGWDVTLLDISQVGLGRAEAQARSLSPAVPEGASVRFVAADLNQYKLARHTYDLILVFFYLQRSLFPALKSALKRGGVLVYKTYTLEHRKFGRGPNHPMYFLKPNELLRAFSSFQILQYREVSKDRGVAELVARKP